MSKLSLTIGFVGASVLSASVGQASLVQFFDYESSNDDTTTSGGITDQTSNNRDGTVDSSDDASFSTDVPTQISTRSNNSIALSETYITSDSPNYKGVLGPHGRTVSVWVKTNESDAGLVSWGNDSGSEAWRFRLDGGDLKVGVAQGAQKSDNVDVANGNWHHVAAVLPDSDSSQSDGNIDLYIDGVLNNGGNKGGSVNTASNFNVLHGAGFDGADVSIEMKGNLDEAAIYDEALSSADIVALSQGADPQNIPEPASLALLGLGGMLMLGRRRR